MIIVIKKGSRIVLNGFLFILLKRQGMVGSPLELAFFCRRKQSRRLPRVFKKIKWDETIGVWF